MFIIYEKVEGKFIFPKIKFIYILYEKACFNSASLRPALVLFEEYDNVVVAGITNNTKMGVLNF